MVCISLASLAWYTLPSWTHIHTNTQENPIFSKCHWMRSYKGKQIRMDIGEKGPVHTFICPNAHIPNSSTVYNFISYSMAIFSRIHRKYRPKGKVWSRRGHWLYSWDSRRHCFHEARSRQTAKDQCKGSGHVRLRHAFANLRKQHGERLVITK